VKVHWLLLPLPSCAVFGHRRRACREGKAAGGTLTTLVTAQLSVAVTLNVTLLVQAPGAVFTVILAGHVITGLGYH